MLTPGHSKPPKTELRPPFVSTDSANCRENTALLIHSREPKLGMQNAFGMWPAVG